MLDWNESYNWTRDDYAHAIQTAKSENQAYAQFCHSILVHFTYNIYVTGEFVIERMKKYEKLVCKNHARMQN